MLIYSAVLRNKPTSKHRIGHVTKDLYSVRYLISSSLMLLPAGPLDLYWNSHVGVPGQ